MEEYNIMDRINALCDAYSWTYYRLAKESGIPYSTLCTMLHKSTAPSIPTLIKLCNGFGITLEQFFSNSAEAHILTDEDQTLLQQWNKLSAENKIAAQHYLRFLLSEQNE